jgi:hypothetical protein
MDRANIASTFPHEKWALSASTSKAGPTIISWNTKYFTENELD